MLNYEILKDHYGLDGEEYLVSIKLYLYVHKYCQKTCLKLKKYMGPAIVSVSLAAHIQSVNSCGQSHMLR